MKKILKEYLNLLKNSAPVDLDELVRKGNEQVSDEDFQKRFNLSELYLQSDLEVKMINRNGDDIVQKVPMNYWWNQVSGVFNYELLTDTYYTEEEKSKIVDALQKNTIN